MRVVIPAAGAGTRLRPYTETIPKVLLPVAGETILGHLVKWVLAQEPTQVVVVVGHLGEQVRDYLADRFPFPFHFVVQEPPGGLGDAVARGFEALRGGGPVLIALGDTIFGADLGALSEGNALGVAPVDDPRAFGVAEMDGERIIRLVEKPDQPRSNLALVGLYYLEDHRPLAKALAELIAEGHRTRGEIQLTDGLQRTLEAGVEFRPFLVDAWFDCGTGSGLLATNRALLDRNGGFVEADIGQALLVSPVAIAPGATVEGSVVGPYASIGRNARVRGSVIRDAVIGEGAVVVDRGIAGTIVCGRARMGRDGKIGKAG